LRRKNGGREGKGERGERGGVRGGMERGGERELVGYALHNFPSVCAISDFIIPPVSKDEG
jgi:hypothetical protein